MDLPVEDNETCAHCDRKKTCIIIHGDQLFKDYYPLCLECLDIAGAKLEKALEARLGYAPTSYDD